MKSSGDEKKKKKKKRRRRRRRRHLLELVTSRTTEPAPPSYCLVGDPVDVVTGAQTDFAYDFVLPGPLPIDWNRDHRARGEQLLPLGSGTRTNPRPSIRTVTSTASPIVAPRVFAIGFPEVDVGGVGADRRRAAVYSIPEPRRHGHRASSSTSCSAWKTYRRPSALVAGATKILTFLLLSAANSSRLSSRCGGGWTNPYDPMV